jgi:CRP-like cAMP-binding protein
VPRTATVTTTEPGELYALERDIFLSAVGSSKRAFAAADETASRHVGALSGGI